MAIYRLEVKHMSRNQGLSAHRHAQYITRNDQRTMEAPTPSPARDQQRTAAEAHTYVSRDDGNARAQGKEDVEAVAHGNMPSWAHDNPGAFWQAADRYEVVNAATAQFEKEQEEAPAAPPRQEVLLEEIRDAIKAGSN